MKVGINNSMVQLVADIPEDFHYITQLERNLKAAVQLRPAGFDAQTSELQHWRLEITLFYDGNPAGKTSFNLHGFSRDEAEYVARNIRDNAYVMKEIDEYLWGESD